MPASISSEVASGAGRKWKMPTKAIITDAGVASRFLPWTKTNPKAMAPIGSKPIMQLVVEECVEAGINEIIIVTTSEGKEIYENYFSDPAQNIHTTLTNQGKPERYDTVANVLALANTKATIRVIEQDRYLPYGNGSPIVSAKRFIAEDEAFVVCYSDDIVTKPLGAETPSDITAMLQVFRSHPDADGVIMGQTVPESVVDKYGMIATKESSDSSDPLPLLDCIIEKPAVGTQPSLLASYGRYLLSPEIFDYLTPGHTGKDNELWTVDGITGIASNGKVYVQETARRWSTTGDPKSFFFAQLENALTSTDYADEVRDYVNNHFTRNGG